MTGDGRDDIDIGTLKSCLVALRAALAETSAASAESRRPVELDHSRVGRLSRLDALQVQAMAVEAERRRGVEIGRIDAALGRIAAGEYGYCVACGDAIAAKRLGLDPAAAVCIDCARGGG